MRIVKVIGKRPPYPVDVNRAVWIDWFVLHQAKLRPQESLRSLTDLALEVYPRLGHVDPIEAAQAEFDAPPPHRVSSLRYQSPYSAREISSPFAAGYPA